LKLLRRRATSRSAEERPGSLAASDLRPFDDRAFESRLVWIFGSPRTGSTWLLRLLTFPLEPATESPCGSAMRRRSRVRPDAVPIDEPYLPQHVTPILRAFADPGAPGFLLNPTRADEPSYFFSNQFAGLWRPELRRMILRRFRGQVQLAEGEYSIEHPLVVVKEPNGSHGAELVMSLLPRSRMIFQLRDGRDVIDSLMHAQMGTGWLVGSPWVEGVQGEEQRLEFVRREARLWVNRSIAVQRAYAAHPADLRIKVRYEDLRADTIGTLRPLVDWLGLDRTDEELEAAIEANRFESIRRRRKGPAKPFRSATPGLWRQNMTEREREVMEQTMGEKLIELGYEL
jgi:hypothetical protein